MYRDCPKKYHYVYGLKLQPVGSKRYFDKGNYFHELSHVYYQLVQAGAEPGSDFLLASMLGRIKKDLASATPENIGVYSNITKVMTRFIKEQSPKIDQDIKVLGIEEEIDVPVTLPSGREVRMFGFIDLRFHRNGVWIRDHKTGEKSWNTQSVEMSPQLMFYGSAIHLRDGSTPGIGISFINTHEWAKKVPTPEQAFAYPNVQPSETSYKNFLSETLQLMDEMLGCKPTPHYDDRMCSYCPFLEPCRLERKGIDPSRIIESNFKIRDESARHTRFSEVTNQNASVV